MGREQGAEQGMSNWWGFLLVWNCPGGESSEWGCPVASCPAGSCPRTSTLTENILYRVPPPKKKKKKKKKNEKRKKKPGTLDFLGLCSNQQLFFFNLLDRTSFPHYNNTKIIKFG